MNGTVEGVVIQSDKPLCYEENGELPPYEGIDADTLGGHPADDFVLDTELTAALAEKADVNHNHNGVYAPVSHTHEIVQVNGLQNQLNGKANSSHTHTVSQITDMPNLTNAIPSGIICMWSGESTDIPSGWHLCDGTQNTPDLRDRFIVGAGSTYGVGTTGGEATHKLTTNEMPSHNHGFTGISHSHTGSLSNATAASAGSHTHTMSGGSSGGYVNVRTTGAGRNTTEAYMDAPGSSIHIESSVKHRCSQLPVYGNSGSSSTISTGGAHTHSVTGSVTVNSATAGGTIGNTGSGQAHENRPPYYALCFIMKL